MISSIYIYIYIKDIQKLKKISEHIRTYQKYQNSSKHTWGNHGVISKILYPESDAKALSLRIYRTPPSKFNCPSRPKIQKNNM